MTKSQSYAKFPAVKKLLNQVFYMNRSALNEFYCQLIESERQALAKQKMLLPPETISELCAAYRRQHRSLSEALLAREGREKPGSVGILQKAFPRRGVVVDNFDHLALAEKLVEAKCAAIGVVTEKNYFEGAPSMLSGITHLVKVPVIRWDMHFDVYQLQQARLWGADAVRLTVAMLNDEELKQLIRSAGELELELVMEAAGVDEIKRILDLNTPCAIYLENEDVTGDELAKMSNLIPENIPILIDRKYNSLVQDRPLPCDDWIIFGA